MALLTDNERQRIEAAIRAVESRTGGELIAVISRASSSYWLIAFMGATAGALLTPIIVALADPMASWRETYQYQLAVSMALFILLRWRRLAMLLVPVAVKRRLAARLARQQFYALNLHETKARTGILLFVSEAERYVEILADRGIDGKAPPGTWAAIVERFTTEVRAGRTAEGFLAAVAACGAQLAEHSPRSADDRNELPDVFIEL